MKVKKSCFLILLCIAAVLGFAGCQEASEQSYKAGTYTAEASGKNGPIEVEVVFSESEIESVEVISHKETEGIFEEPVEKIPKNIVEQQSLAVDSIAGATYTSDAILKAVEDCVVQAEGNVEVLKEAEEQKGEAKTEQLEYDIIVVGAGAAGTSAALKASEENDRVLLLEKTAYPMGAATLAGGMFAAESNLQKEAGETVDKEWLYEKSI
ncbi:MAG TPA: hypothetical protein DHN33_10240 [Eubacteriaceae bacterium]|nr:hypothetical protein [Eubacteriaceae bacterium]